MFAPPDGPHMAKPTPNTPAKLVTLPTLAAELKITPRTLRRWMTDPELGFPAPTRIRTRVYFDRASVEAWREARFGQAA